MLHGMLLAVFVLLACGCGNLYQALADDLTLEPVTIEDPSIRLDGLWYSIGQDGRYYAFSFLYRSGHICYIGSRFYTLEFDEELANILESDEHKTFARNNQLSTGVFNVDGSTIRIEKWYPSSGGPNKAYVQEGCIVNDTLIVINEFYRMKKGKKKNAKELDIRYYFKEYSPKPDSFNIFTPM